MKSFLQQHSGHVLGAVRGFDRLRFRGTFRQVAYVDGMLAMLSYLKVLLKDFGQFVDDTTSRLRAGIESVASEAGRPSKYLPSSATDKEQLVDQVIRQQGIGPNGIIAIFRVLEPCQSFEIHRNRAQKILELRAVPRKCLHYYIYGLDSHFGRTQVRIQTWFPFNVYVVLNGREWLSHQLDAAGVAYQRRDNCFNWISDFSKAQQLLDKQLQIDWVQHLTRLLDAANPILRKLLIPWELQPYWSADQTEWATDIAFRSRKALAQLYPALLQHAMRTFDSREVMRFLGRKFSRQPYINGRFEGQVVSDIAARPEGMRIKHRVKNNSIKMYDKQGSVLRVETTLNDASDLKAYRTKEGDPDGPLSYRRLRKGVADLSRRAQLSDAANNRYLEGLAVVSPTTSLKAVTNSLCHPTWRNGRRYRALNLFAQADTQLLRTVARGEYLIQGFRNADIRQALFGADPKDPAERRRRTARTSRLLALLRAHHLIKKIPNTHRYQLTKSGQRQIAAILAAQDTSVSKLLDAA